jgi:hypothetical protein
VLNVYIVGLTSVLAYVFTGIQNPSELTYCMELHGKHEAHLHFLYLHINYGSRDVAGWKISVHRYVPKGVPIAYIYFPVLFKFPIPRCTMKRGNSVGIATDYALNGRKSIPGRDKRFLSTPHRPDWL